MGEYMVLSIDTLDKASASSQPLHGVDAQGPLIEGETHVKDNGLCDALKEEKEDLIQILECRICLEEGTLQNLDIPCACSGTMKFAHTRCVQQWYYEKGDTICEICCQPLKRSYTATSPLYRPRDTSINIREDLTSNTHLDFQDHRRFMIAAVEHRVVGVEHEDYVYTGIYGTTLFRFTALTLMVLLILEHVVGLFNFDAEKSLTYIIFVFVRAAIVILPCYLMARIIRIIHHRRQRQQAAA